MSKNEDANLIAAIAASNPNGGAGWGNHAKRAPSSTPSLAERATASAAAKDPHYVARARAAGVDIGITDPAEAQRVEARQAAARQAASELANRPRSTQSHTINSPFYSNIGPVAHRHPIDTDMYVAPSGIRLKVGMAVATGALVRLPDGRVVTPSEAKAASSFKRS